MDGDSLGNSVFAMVFQQRFIKVLGGNLLPLAQTLVLFRSKGSAKVSMFGEAVADLVSSITILIYWVAIDGR